MTPLTWWVLLATLFGHARIVPARIYEIENACAILCRAEKLLLLESNEEGNLVGKVGEKEGNENDEEDVEEGKVEEVGGGEKAMAVGEENYEVIHVTSQFVEGRRGGLHPCHRRRPRRRRRRRRRRDGVVNDHNHNHHDHHDHRHSSLNDYCLTSNQIRLHCREFFINLRNRQGCNCRLISSSIRTNLIEGGNINPKDSNKLSNLSQKREQQQQQQGKQQQFRQVVVVEEEEEEAEIREEDKRFLLATMKTMMRNPKELSTIEDYHYYLPIKMESNNQELVSSAPDNPSNSDEIDWDLWCMAQCDIGHGGSACECDIIP